MAKKKKAKVVNVNNQKQNQQPEIRKTPVWKRIPWKRIGAILAMIGGILLIILKVLSGQNVTAETDDAPVIPDPDAEEDAIVDGFTDL